MGQTPGLRALSQTAGVSRPLGGMTRKSLHMQSFLQQKAVPVTRATPQTKPDLQRLSLVFLLLRVSAPSQSLSFEHSAVHSAVVSTSSDLVRSRAGRRHTR